jgi:3-deoxy-D-manno-octulosonate 8-phosphate phosphatase (KDO 8-P phosphatase)
MDPANGIGPEVRERASRVRMVLLDVDGVLTDGRLHMGSDGTEGRTFHVRDGHGIRMGQRGGLLFGILSGRESRVVSNRAAELYITEVHQGVFDKLQRLNEILERLLLPIDGVCFVGDDLVDVPVMRRVGLAAAPCDAMPEARQAAHYVTACAGGRGAVREVVDLVLRASGRWDQATERFFK